MLPRQRARIQSLVSELRSSMLHSVAKNLKLKKNFFFFKFELDFLLSSCVESGLEIYG